MFVIGLTGGTGAGKTTALEAVRTLGGIVIDCDAVYHELLVSDRELLAELEASFPGTVENGALDRKKLGTIVFGDGEKLKTLNAITHGHVCREVERRLALAERNGAELAAVDAIGLFESGLSELCDMTAAVTAPEEDRVKRLMAREGISEDYARLRIRAQKPAEWFSERSSATWENNGSREEFAAFCENEIRRSLTEHDRRPTDHKG